MAGKYADSRHSGIALWLHYTQATWGHLVVSKVFSLVSVLRLKRHVMVFLRCSKPYRQCCSIAQKPHIARTAHVVNV